jgi:hypothetical protein
MGAFFFPLIFFLLYILEAQRGYDTLKKDRSTATEGRFKIHPRTSHEGP